MDEDCALCVAIRQKPINNNEKVNIFNKILYESENFVVLPSIGPISLGHVMIVSKKHYNNFSEMTLEEKSNFNDIIELITQRYQIYKTNLLIVEHGAIETCSAGGCVIHTHIHLIPGYSKKEDCLKVNLELMEIVEGWEKMTERDYPYLAICGNKKTIHIFKAKDLPNQYLRRILLPMQGEDVWDWVLKPNIPLIEKTVKYWDKKCE